MRTAPRSRRSSGSALHGAGRARAHQAGDLQAELVAHALGGREGLGAVRVADDLHQAFAVAQVDEDHAAVVAAAVHPAEQGDGLAQVLERDLAAVAATHDSEFSRVSAAPAMRVRTSSLATGPRRPSRRCT